MGELTAKALKNAFDNLEDGDLLVVDSEQFGKCIVNNITMLNECIGELSICIEYCNKDEKEKYIEEMYDNNLEFCPQSFPEITIRQYKVYKEVKKCKHT